MSLVTYKERKWKCYLTNGASIAHKLEKTLSRRPQNHSNFNFPSHPPGELMTLRAYGWNDPAALD